MQYIKVLFQHVGNIKSWDIFELRSLKLSAKWLHAVWTVQGGSIAPPSKYLVIGEFVFKHKYVKNKPNKTNIFKNPLKYNCNRVIKNKFPNFSLI